MRNLIFARINSILLLINVTEIKMNASSMYVSRCYACKAVVFKSPTFVGQGLAWQILVEVSLGYPYQSNHLYVDYKSDSRYKKYHASVEKTLQSFESVGEWADIISFLNRLSKVNNTLYKMYAHFFE